jgi:predicted peptidase
LIAAAFLAAVFTLSPAKEKQFLRLSFEGAPYRLFVPSDYTARKRYPLVVFLHGGGGRGSDNEAHLRDGNGMLADLFARGETLLVAPQTATEHDARRILDLLGYITEHYSVDRDRIYLVGQSLGGFGALAAQPDRFAGAVIIAAARDPALAPRLVRVPLWFFHGERDDVIPVDQPRRLVAAIRHAGGSVKFTEYRGEGHGLAWLVVRERELARWLFAHSRKQ